MRRAIRTRRCSPNSRNGTTPKTVASQVGDVELDVPRDRDGTFTPRLVPEGLAAARRPRRDDHQPVCRRDDVRDIEHHLATTVGTELSHETISKITDEVLDEVLAWQQRPLEAFYPVIYLDALVVKVRDGAHVRNKAAHIAVGVDIDGVKHVLGIWVQATEGAKFWAGVCAEPGQPRRQRRAHRVLRRAHRLPRGDRGDLADGDRADLRGAPDPGRDAVRELQGPQGRRRRAESRSTRPPTPRPPRPNSTRSPPPSSASATRTRSPPSPPPGNGSPRSWPSRPSCAGSSTPPTRSSR